MEYCARKRDPPPNADGSDGESAIEDDDEMSCVDGAVGDTTTMNTGLPVYSRPYKVGTVQKIDLGCS